jgi:transketolase
MVSESLKAAETLAREKVEAKVVNMHTIKPIDEEIIIRSAKETGAIVTAEEHQINGGLGGAVAEVLVRNCPVPQRMVAVHDTFGESGDPEGLLRKYHLKDVDIVEAARDVLRRKS